MATVASEIGKYAPPPSAYLPKGPFGMGCGTGANDSWIPEHFLAADFSTSCQKHDDCCDICRTPKSNCDKNFGEDLREACGGILNFGCNRAANLYVLAVRLAGDDAYGKAQTSACGCN